MNRGSITKINDGTVKITMDPRFLLMQPAFVRRGDVPEPVTPGMDMKEMIACVAWAQLAYKAPHLFSLEFRQKNVSYENGVFVVNFTKDMFGFLPPFP
jgi:hypothetical protein